MLKVIIASLICFGAVSAPTASASTVAASAGPQAGPKFIGAKNTVKSFRKYDMTFKAPKLPNTFNDQSVFMWQGVGPNGAAIADGGVLQPVLMYGRDIVQDTPAGKKAGLGPDLDPDWANPKKRYWYMSAQYWFSNDPNKIETGSIFKVNPGDTLVNSIVYAPSKSGGSVTVSVTDTTPSPDGKPRTSTLTVQHPRDNPDLKWSTAFDCKYGVWASAQLETWNNAAATPSTPLPADELPDSFAGVEHTTTMKMTLETASAEDGLTLLGKPPYVTVTPTHPAPQQTTENVTAKFHWKDIRNGAAPPPTRAIGTIPFTGPVGDSPTPPNGCATFAIPAIPGPDKCGPQTPSDTAGPAIVAQPSISDPTKAEIDFKTEVRTQYAGGYLDNGDFAVTLQALSGATSNKRSPHWVDMDKREEKNNGGSTFVSFKDSWMSTQMRYRLKFEAHPNGRAELGIPQLYGGQVSRVDYVVPDPLATSVTFDSVGPGGVLGNRGPFFVPYNLNEPDSVFPTDRLMLDDPTKGYVEISGDAGSGETYELDYVTSKNELVTVATSEPEKGKFDVKLSTKTSPDQNADAQYVIYVSGRVGNHTTGTVHRVQTVEPATRV